LQENVRRSRCPHLATTLFQAQSFERTVTAVGEAITEQFKRQAWDQSNAAQPR
jgi:hypothetical protein